MVDGRDGNMPYDVALAIINTIHKRQVIITVPMHDWLNRSARITFEALGIPLDAKVIDTRTNQMDRTVDVKLAHDSFPFVPDREKIPKWEDVMADVIGKTEVTSTMTRGKIDTTPEVVQKSAEPLESLGKNRLQEIRELLTACAKAQCIAWGTGDVMSLQHPRHVAFVDGKRVVKILFSVETIE